ncbi:MAG: alkaline phosphatase family protein [Chloroflexota bacterium]|nr:alkaline phosphatase family protein [Chloroflexota bacterium]
MGRVAIIGIDGMDADLLRVYGPSLPNLRRLMLESPFLELKSTFPPEAPPAWASVYTGLNPANHGMLSRTDEPGSQEVSWAAAILQGQTFWDLVGEAGRRVCVLNPYLAYPAWPVNGIMLSLPPLDAKGLSTSITPEAVSLSRAFPSLLDVMGTSVINQPGDFYRSLYELTVQQAELGLELFYQEAWDLFFLQLEALDYVQHLFWRYSDPSDPTYPGRNEHSSRIHDFYRLLDQIIGQYRSHMPPDCMLAVVSGYGHGRRCTQRLNLNEWLRTQGLLTPHVRSVRLLDRHYLAERARTRSMELLAQFRSPDIAQHLQRRPRPPRPAYVIDQQATMAQVADIGGISAFGGINLNRACIEQAGQDYDELCETLIQRLVQLQPKGRPVVHWARRREQVYQGTHTHLFPDILFELLSDFGVSENLYINLVSSNVVHRLISGAHRMHGVFLLGNIPRAAALADETRDITVMDVAPTLLSLAGITHRDRDGRALLIPQDSRQLT